MSKKAFDAILKVRFTNTTTDVSVERQLKRTVIAASESLALEKAKTDGMSEIMAKNMLPAAVRDTAKVEVLSITIK